MTCEIKSGVLNRFILFIFLLIFPTLTSHTRKWYSNTFSKQLVSLWPTGSLMRENPKKQHCTSRIRQWSVPLSLNVVIMGCAIVSLTERVTCEIKSDVLNWFILFTILSILTTSTNPSQMRYSNTFPIHLVFNWLATSNCPSAITRSHTSNSYSIQETFYADLHQVA